MNLRRKPHKIRPKFRMPVQAWWYENATGIDVYVFDQVMGKTLNITIRRADLMGWVKRSKQRLK